MAENTKGLRNKAAALTAELLAHRVIVWWLPVLYLLISSLFYLRTYDSAQVKITVMQMGGLALLTLWVVRLIEAGGAAFTKDDLVTLSPFLAYLAVGVFSFLHAPYNMASVDFFLRHFFFMTVALIVIYEFEQAATERLTRILIWTGWIAVGYGMLQTIDTRFFPPGAGKGIDPFIWRGAFGTRVFSTYGNPNFYADFLVILFPILLMQYLKRASFGKLVLMGMLLVNLILTGTKGAWVGFAMVLAMLGGVAFTYFPRLLSHTAKKAILGATIFGVLGFLAVVGKDLRTRIVSVNFRLFTWEATWEMIRTQPLIGTGIGSFPPVYPAFRRPPIFHIEGKHNTETDHAENEYIEQFFDNGLLGFGVFLWLIFSTLYVGFSSLRHLTTVLADREGRPPGRAYDLVGYMIAFMGMLGHNLFDVSMRFVSSGVYLGLLSGMIVNLARGKGLYELHELRENAAAKPATPAWPPADEKSVWRTIADFLIWPARLAAWGGLAYIAYTIFAEFSALQGPLSPRLGGGEALQWWLSWGVLAACVLGMAATFARIAFTTENPVVPLVVLAALQPLYLFWGYFKADIHHNIAIFFSKERNWDQALSHYFIVNKLNPNFVMSLYFMGNVYNDRFIMDKVYKPEWGDKDNVARDDYERAMDSYDKVRRLAPNYVQMHHQVGALHMKRAEYAMAKGQPDEAQRYLDLALNRFKLYQQIDPVFAPNYFRMGQIYMVRKQYEQALETYRAYVEADQCAVAPSLISKKWLRNSILSYQNYVEEPGVPHEVHRHESADGYTNLANAYYMLERLEEAEKAYRHALFFDPNFEQAKRNLSVVYQKAQQQGRLRKLAAPKPDAGPGPFTGYEIAPKK